MRWVAAGIVAALAALAWALYDLDKTLARASRLPEDHRD